MSYDLDTTMRALAAWWRNAVSFPTTYMDSQRMTLEGALPYNIMEALGPGVLTDSWGGIYDECEQSIQLISYGETGQQASILASRSSAVFLDNSTSMSLGAGTSVMKRQPDGGQPSAEKVASNLWEVPQRFLLRMHLR
jgi:hypothetical protein